MQGTAERQRGRRRERGPEKTVRTEGSAERLRDHEGAFGRAKRGVGGAWALALSGGEDGLRTSGGIAAAGREAGGAGRCGREKRTGAACALDEPRR